MTKASPAWNREPEVEHVDEKEDLQTPPEHGSKTQAEKDMFEVHVMEAGEHEHEHRLARRTSRHHSLHPEANMTEVERQEYMNELVIHGEQKFHKLGWFKLLIVLILQAIALGSLSLPSAFATLGMVAGVICVVGIGLVAIYAAYVVGQVKLKYPQVKHYSDVGPILGRRLVGPRFGRCLEIFMATWFMVVFVLLIGSHCLTGTVAFRTISESDVCGIVWGVVSMVLLFICALPPSFAEMAILGYIDFVSIAVAILLTLIATGVQASKRPGGIASVDWSAWPQEGLSFSHGMLAVTNIVFAYAFAMCQFSFMEEMHTPTDFPKSIAALGVVEIVIYTLTGALGYAFVGNGVKSPALLSAGPLVARIAFGIALPVIFISGSINTVTAGRFLMDKVFTQSTIRYVNTPMGWVTWVSIVGIISILAWIVAEAIPFFNGLLGIMAALFVSGFSFYVPGIMWFALIKEGGAFANKRNTFLSVVNVLVIVVGLITLGCGTYAAIDDIATSYRTGTMGGSFKC